MEIRQFQKVNAVFSRIRTDDLQEGLEACVGRTFEFTKGWLIDEGVYKDQWAFTVQSPFPAAWIPECDLDFARSAIVTNE